MISILIPTYNYSITQLLQALKPELETIVPNFEIICFEDGSSKYVEDNGLIINTTTNAKHIISKVNKGRITTRQSLAEMAKFDWLLFLDADVVPALPTFLRHYLEFTNLSYDAVYGGYDYDSEKPNEQFMLRWKYGNKYEHVAAELRNYTPYKIVISGNFLIKKSIFLDINSKIKNDGYGYDNIFAAFMKSNNIKIFHINNNAIHKGLDNNIAFLNKIEKAVETIYEFNQKHDNITTDNTLLEFYKRIKSLGLSGLTSFIFKLSKGAIHKLVLRNNPNLTLLQFYKLGYLCSLTSNRK